MGIFGRQLLNVIEWNETRDDVLFWKWNNDEIKKGSRLIIRPGQDAIFLYNGKIEGVFKDEGNYEIETQIIPFLSTLKGFKFGFNSGLRAEVLFVNTKEFLVRWGTKNPINIPAQNMPGGIPIRAFGTFNVKIDDYIVLIDKIAGIKKSFTIKDIEERTLSLLDQLLMKWIVKEGKDMFNLQANAYDIARGIKEDLDMDLIKIGLTVTDLKVSSFNYPEQIQKMIEKNASYEMVGDLGRYQHISAVDSLEKNPGGSMNNMVQAGLGLAMGAEMINNMKKMTSSNESSAPPASSTPSTGLICKNCSQPLAANMKFCSNCGEKVELATSTGANKFCSQCGAKLDAGAKFCSECGNKL
ncbi:MAG: zinc-ribbon domain-containing protein [Epulopiscium sp.]|nr:zinc-ribbon domain-containing protein [Candidatus Epulonipiscium sp.]